MKTVKEIMSTDCITVELTDTLYETAVKMRKYNIGFIPVVEGTKLVGVITDRDLVIRGYADRRNESTTVKEIVSKDVRSISPQSTVEEAAKIMAKEQIRRLPVVEHGDLLGIVAIADMAIRKNFENEAGDALSQISEPSRV